VEFSDELYDAGVDQVLAAVRAADEAAGVVLVVGHEPAMSRTASALAGLGSDEATYARIQLGVPTASWSVLKLLGPWSELTRGSARLERLQVPAS
jgi:phosphohistidine phosphatase